MRKRKNIIRILAALCSALGWWGFLYPELTLTPDTVKIVYLDESGDELNTTECTYDSRLYFKILGAEKDRITYRSKLLDDWNAFWEAIHDTEQ